jgi:hypothetical protein
MPKYYFVETTKDPLSAHTVERYCIVLVFTQHYPPKFPDVTMDVLPRKQFTTVAIRKKNIQKVTFSFVFVLFVGILESFFRPRRRRRRRRKKEESDKYKSDIENKTKDKTLGEGGICFS